MQTTAKLSFVAAAAVLAGACGTDFADPATPTAEGLALVSIQPSSAPAPGQSA
jgi:hypothetical protein